MDNMFILGDRLQKIRQIINKYGEDKFYIAFSVKHNFIFSLLFCKRDSGTDCIIAAAGNLKGARHKFLAANSNLVQPSRSNRVCKLAFVHVGKHYPAAFHKTPEHRIHKSRRHLRVLCQCPLACKRLNFKGFGYTLECCNIV